jgi:hypothetical protein
MDTPEHLEQAIVHRARWWVTDEEDRQKLTESMREIAHAACKLQREADLDHPWVDEELAGSIRNTPLVVPSTED